MKIIFAYIVLLCLAQTNEAFVAVKFNLLLDQISQLVAAKARVLDSKVQLLRSISNKHRSAAAAESSASALSSASYYEPTPLYSQPTDAGYKTFVQNNYYNTAAAPSLAGHNYFGPGNPLNHGPPVDTDDTIAYYHDAAYARARTPTDIRRADWLAIRDFDTDFHHNGNLHSALGATALAAKYTLESYTGSNAVSSAGGFAGSGSGAGGFTGSGSGAGGFAGSGSGSFAGGQSASNAGSFTGSNSLANSGGFAGSNTIANSGGFAGGNSLANSGGFAGSNSLANSGGFAGRNSLANSGGFAGSNSLANSGGFAGSNSLANSGSFAGSNSAANAGSFAGSNSAANAGSNSAANAGSFAGSGASSSAITQPISTYGLPSTQYVNYLSDTLRAVDVNVAVPGFVPNVGVAAPGVNFNLH